MWRVFVCVAAGVASGCIPLDLEGDLYACATAADCLEGYSCQAALCRAGECTRAVCGTRCGAFDDLCGGQLTCTCANGTTCVSGTCQTACVPTGCGNRCGTNLDDGCGTMITCSCTLPLVCGARAAGACGKPFGVVTDATQLAATGGLDVGAAQLTADTTTFVGSYVGKLSDRPAGSFEAMRDSYFAQFSGESCELIRTETFFATGDDTAKGVFIEGETVFAAGDFSGVISTSESTTQTAAGTSDIYLLKGPVGGVMPAVAVIGSTGVDRALAFARGRDDEMWLAWTFSGPALVGRAEIVPSTLAGNMLLTLLNDKLQVLESLQFSASGRISGRLVRLADGAMLFAGTRGCADTDGIVACNTAAVTGRLTAMHAAYVTIAGGEASKFEGDLTTAATSGIEDAVALPGGGYALGGWFVHAVRLPGMAKPLEGAAVRQGFVAVFDARGGLRHAISFPSETPNSVTALALDEKDGLVVGGAFSGTLVLAEAPLVAQGPSNAFAAGLDGEGKIRWALPWTGSGTVAVDGLLRVGDALRIVGHANGALKLGGKDFSGEGDYGFVATVGL